MKPFVLIITPTLLLYACSMSESKNDSVMPSSLSSTEWVVRSIDGASSEVAYLAKVSFHANGQLTGQGDCYEFEGRYAADERSRAIEIEITGATAHEECDAVARKRENMVMDQLQQVVAFKIDMPSLVLEGEQGRRLFLMPITLY